MSFVPPFFHYLVDHLQKDERRQMLTSIVVTAAPEHWLSLESAALLDINRNRFGLQELLNERPNVPRWLIAAERRKIDLWIEDQCGELPHHAIEFKVVHNNKNAYTKIWEIRRDLGKHIPGLAGEAVDVERWGIVLLVFHRFYDDQAGGYAVNRSFADCDEMLDAFCQALDDDHEWYDDAPRLQLACSPVQICDTSTANYIDPTKGQSAVFLALVKKRAAPKA